MSGEAGSWNKTGSDSCVQEVCERPSNVSAMHSLSCRASTPILPGCLLAHTACPCLRSCLALPVLGHEMHLGWALGQQLWDGG